MQKTNNKQSMGLLAFSKLCDRLRPPSMIECDKAATSNYDLMSPVGRAVEQH